MPIKEDDKQKDKSVPVKELTPEEKEALRAEKSAAATADFKQKKQILIDDLPNQQAQWAKAIKGAIEKTKTRDFKSLYEQLRDSFEVFKKFVEDIKVYTWEEFSDGYYKALGDKELVSEIEAVRISRGDYEPEEKYPEHPSASLHERFKKIQDLVTPIEDKRKENTKKSIPNPPESEEFKELKKKLDPEFYIPVALIYLDQARSLAAKKGLEENNLSPNNEENEIILGDIRASYGQLLSEIAKAQKNGNVIELERLDGKKDKDGKIIKKGVKQKIESLLMQNNLDKDIIQQQGTVEINEDDIFSALDKLGG